MSNKEILISLIEEGQNKKEKMLTGDDTAYRIWKEKVERSIERIFGKDSTEYKEITHKPLTTLSINPNNMSSKSDNSREKDIENKIIFLKAWVELEE